MLNLARSLIERGHRADLVIPRLGGDYLSDVPRGMRIYRARLPHTDRKFLRGVRRTGVEVEAMTINPIGVARAWRVLDRRVPDLSGTSRYHIYAYAYMMARYMRETGPDLVVSALPGANAAAVCAAELTERVVPTVITVRNNVAADYAPSWLATARVLFPLADAVVGVSRGVGESVRQVLGVDAERLHVIYNGVPVDRIRRLAADEVAHPWFEPGAPPVILSVGREAPAKDYPTLVTAFGLARREVEARLLLLGRLSPRYRARLTSLAAGQGVERDLGFVDFDENPYRYMSRAGLVALASRWEGLGMVILEALACGTPVVSTDTPYGPREILGGWGELPPVGDAVALGRALVGALRGERPTEAALRARAAEFSIEQAADAYVALFRKLAGRVGTVRPNNLRIAFALTSLNAGGAERNMLNLARSLIERGHRADLVIPRLGGDYLSDVPRGMRIYRARLPHTDRKFLRGVRRTGVEVEAMTINPIGVARAWRVLDRRVPDLSGTSRYHIYAYAYMMARYMRETGPDLVVSALPGANAAAVYAAELMERVVPTVITVHNNVAADYAPSWLATARVLFPLADAVVGVSRGVGESVRQVLGVDAERLHVIYNGVPLDRIRRLAADEVAHPWFEPGAPPVILSVGREAPAKDYPTLVTAFGLARREVEARLLLLGRLSPRYRARLMSLAAGQGVERDLGFVDFDENPYRYMSRAGLVALASRWEGLGMVILEALACGTPVVSTDTPYGPREILGGWGELPPVGDAVALGRALVGALRGERPPEAALRARAAEFSIEQAADAYVALFRKLAGR